MQSWTWVLDWCGLHGQTLRQAGDRHRRLYVAVVHEYGIDAVFSVLSQGGTVEEALTNAAANVRSASRNIAATLKLALEMQAH
jgi:glycerate kinase